MTTLHPHVVRRSPRPLLLLDVDTPLAMFDEHAFERFTELGFEMDIDDPSLQSRRYLTDHVIDEEQRAASRAVLEEAGWFADLPVVPGAQEGVEALLTAGVDIFACTKPMEKNPTCHSDKQAWITKNFPDLTNRVIQTPNKGLSIGDVLLDDAPMLEWMEYAAWKPLIYRTPFNGFGSDWGDFPSFDWSESIDVVVEYLELVRSGT